MKILLLGDSLLYGYLTPSTRSAPAERIRERLGPDSVVEIAIPGIRTHELLTRFTKQKSLPKFGAVFVLCGTNDLGHGQLPSNIANYLSKLYKAVRKQSPGAKVYAMSIPSSAHRALDGPRAEANAAIKIAAEGQGAHFLDFHSLMGPYGGPLWNRDGLHFSEVGYRRIAEILLGECTPWEPRIPDASVEFHINML